MGTSGFLYRSNKLMYDHETKSMWSTLEGKPVVGALVGQGIQLKPLQCVTTTWGQWRKQNPDTTVLSLETGHTRNYDEGAAYRSYFANDELMFKVPKLDDRLKNKAEVLAIRLDEMTDQRMAISAEFLKQNRIYHGKLGDVSFVVLTDPAGGNRIYEAEDHRFESFWPDDQEMQGLVDASGERWTISEKQLQSGDNVLNRLPAHRAFWFGWYAQFPDTELIH